MIMTGFLQLAGGTNGYTLEALRRAGLLMKSKFVADSNLRSAKFVHRHLTLYPVQIIVEKL